VRSTRHATGRRSLQLVQPESLEDATAALGNGSVALAGGTELVPLLRSRLVEAETLVDVRAVVPRGVHEDGSRIGAGTTLAELEADPEIPAALREACTLASSPQLRSMGTIGGSTCHARKGAHREHAIFGNEHCASAHPSDPAAALLALGATLRTDRRELPVADLYRLPTEDDRDVTALEPGELILELDVPRPEASTYLKAMERNRFSFALVGVAAARTGGGTRLALAGVAPIPWLLEGEDGLDRATPLPGTAYKVDLARPLVRRALEALG